MRNRFHTIPCLILLLSLLCIQCQTSEKASVYELSAYSSNNHIQAVIEIPAGTSKKIEFNTRSKQFEVDQRNGKDRVIQYLPYPANYGFIPGTFSDPTKGGDGDALDILILCESVPTGTIMEVLPIGMLKLIDDGELDYKIIAIPVDQTLRTVDATRLDILQEKFPYIQEIIAQWFLNYDPGNHQEIQGMGNEAEALNEIKSQLKS
jgi:inorganic pyrophosphatase